MQVKRSKTRRLVGQFLLCTLILNGVMGLAGELSHVRAQRRVIVVNAEQPNVWTLEQAHYLLAQMHRRNLDLRAKKLEELDPNEINGLRFDVLRQLIEFGATFNQADQLTNQILSRNKSANSDRRLSLTASRDKLREESLELTRQISQLQSDKARATTQEDKDRIDAEISARTSLRDKVDKQVEFADNELKTLGDGSGEFKATEGGATFDSNKLPKSVFDKAFEDAAKSQIEKFNESPQLNATLRLENFLQMQYEIIAKQLTLLRDEVGPGERLLFLELPQTVNVTHHEADKKWAQSWWRIVGYTMNAAEYEKRVSKRQTASNKNIDPSSAARNRAPETTSKKIEEILTGLGGRQGDWKIPLTNGNYYISLQSQHSATVPVWDDGRQRNVPIDDRTVRTVELIPRQSSLNVNDMKLETRAGAFSFVLSTLFGFGSKLNVQRQREQFSQFVQQELYSSAFGKGSREFGWTFTPMPGTDRLLSGVRTTYAVVTVPEEATSVMLESNGCYFPRSYYQPIDFNDTLDRRWQDERTSRSCGDSKAFLVPIPVGGSGLNDFFVEGLTYRPVDKGERIVVSVYGYNFSSQMGVLVNGSPLKPAIGLAQPLLRDDSATGEAAAKDLKGEKVHGIIERLDSEQMVFSFEMPADYTNTPNITLVAPGKAVDLNPLPHLYINGTPNTTLDASAPMFNLDPDPTVKIEAVEVFRSPDGRSLTALASGKGFNSATQNAFVNGVPLTAGSFVSPSLIRAEIPTPPDEIIQVALSTGNKTIRSKPVANPAYLRINNVTIVSYEPAGRRSLVPVLIVKLEGVGFSEWLVPSQGNLTSLSATEALLRIENPAMVTTLVLRDSRTGFEARTVITRKPAAK
jgi:hypothetical protein